MTKINWIKSDSSLDNWNTAADWSTGTVPGPGDDVVIAVGRGPEVTTPISIRSLVLGPATIQFSRALLFVSAGASSVSADVSIGGGDAIILDENFGPTGSTGPGGSTLTIGGTLTNGGFFDVGDSSLSAPSTLTAAAVDNVGAGSGVFVEGNSHNQATLRVTGAAGFGTAGVLTGQVFLSGDALIEFSSGQIATIAAGSLLNLRGSQARVADAADTATNSALVGLTSNQGRLFLESSNIATSGDLANSGVLATGFGIDLVAGSTFTIGGKLTNSGDVSINRFISPNGASMTAAGLDNTGGRLELFGDANTNSQATLDITAAAGSGTAGVLTGQVELSGNGLLEFSSGQITTIASGATLSLSGPKARVADASDTTTNSALVGLTSNLGDFSFDSGALSTNGAFSNAGNLTLLRGALLTTGGALRNSGALSVDLNFNGPSQLTIGGALINSGTLTVGQDFLHAPATTTVTATGLNNSGGQLSFFGGTLDITAAAGFVKAGVLTGSVSLKGALLEFSSGQITTIVKGASLTLDSSFGSARIADVSDTTTNSALTGLASNAGALTLVDNQVAPVGAFSNSGTMDVQTSFGSALFAVAGKLTNTGTINIDRPFALSDGSAEIDAASLSNNGTINFSPFTLSHQTAKLAIAGATGGTGSINLAYGCMADLGGPVGAGQTIAFSGTGSTLELRMPGRFAGAITGFGVDDTLDLAGETVTGFAYAGSTLTLTLAGGARQAFNFSGTFGNLRTADDGNGGTDIVGLSNQFTLTTGSDSVDFIQGTNTVNGRAATLNPGDSLTGGSGIDTLALTGAGTFDLAALAKFTGFERVTLDNTNSTVLKLRAGAPVAATGGIRNNKYYVANAGDLISDPAGRDQVLASVTYALQAGQAIEKLSTANSSASTAINLTGNEFADGITGNAGANVLNGRAGNDTLTGLGGHDTFVFSTALDASSNVDTITDFATTAANPIAHDMIALSDAIFAAVGPAGGLAGSAFHVGTGASDADQRIIYDGATGGLFYDADGSGAAAQVQFARLTPGLAMTSADFKVV